MTSASSGGPLGAAGRVHAVVGPVVAAAGLHLEDVRVAPAGRRTVVRVVVDLDEDAVGSLGSDRLGDVSREISRAMDAADPVRGEHVLEVTTPGTDRPLTELRHLRRARTRLVRLTLRDGTTASGRLLAAEPDGLVLDTGTEERAVPLEQVVRGEVEVELRGQDEHEDEEA